MKNFYESGGGICPIPKKLLLVMKLTAFLIVVLTMQVTATVYSQNKKLSLNMQGNTIKEVLQQIEAQSEYRFIYENEKVNLDAKVSIRVKDEVVENILKQLFAKDGINYSITDNNLILINPSDKQMNNWGKESINSQQQKSVSGKVTDSSGAPLPGVSVVVKGTTNGTITDVNGKYLLTNIPASITLQFSFIGMKTQEIAVNGKTLINVKLEEEAVGIDEVVAVGYGTQTKRSISGSVSNVSEKNFNKGVNQTAIDLLKGKVAGLTITQASGDVTEDQTIRLRGVSSLTGSSQPFVVVDGVPGVSINSVAPQDIESISILKDASAAAIYGSRSASGVILITTKKGKKDTPTVEYDGYVGISNVTNMPDLLTAQEWRDYCSKNSINTTGIDLGANTNWFDAIMRTGISQNQSFSLSGGGANSNYRASINYMDVDGVVKDNSIERYNARLTFNQKALDNMLDLSFTGALTVRDYSPTDTKNFILACNMIPVVPIKNEDGSWYESTEFDHGNPLHNIELNKFSNKNSVYYGDFIANLNLFKGFNANLNLLKERSTNDYGEYLDSETERGRDYLGLATREGWTNDRNLLEATVNYKKTIKNHDLNFLAGYSYENTHYQSFGARNRQFVTDSFGFNNLSAGEDLQSGDVWSSANMSKLISFFGRLNYSFKERYILALALRRDGSSKFGDNHKWGTFPSISGAWHVSEEPFLKSMSYIDDLKFRVGYGVSGNQDGIEPYKSLELYGASGKYYDSGSWYSAYQISQNANPDLKWEETSMFNIGLDFGFFKNRLNGTLEYYNKKTNDLLYNYSVPVPPNIYPTTLANVGAMTNKGFELLLNADVIRKENLRWTVSVNLAHNKNEITKLSNATYSTSAILTGSAFVRGGSYNTTHIVEEGKAVGTFYGYKCLGLDSDGKFIFDDMIDGVTGLTSDDRTYIGCAQPKLTYGFSSAVSWKKWDLNLFFRGVYGNDVLNFNRLAYATTQWLPGGNCLSEALESGLTDTPQYSSYYIEKGSFLRLDNASLGYSFDTAKLKFIQKMRIYVTGQNLFTITKYKGLDPEVEMAGLDPGIEGRTYYPKSRTWLIGLNINF